MPELTKNEAIIQTLSSFGCKEIILRVIPKLFYFQDGTVHSELEFSRRYFDETSLATLQATMEEKILPAIRKNPGKRIYVTEHGMSVFPIGVRGDDKNLTSEMHNGKEALH